MHTSLQTIKIKDEAHRPVLSACIHRLRSPYNDCLVCYDALESCKDLPQLTKPDPPFLRAVSTEKDTR